VALGRPASAQPQLLDMQGTQNLTSLKRKFDTSRYMAATSDTVALMTLEHQTRISNLMTRIGWDTRIAEANGPRWTMPSARN
jgi:hypothetical protein